MAATDVAEYERLWIEALNRGDVAAADRAFAPDAVIHITGAPEPALSLDAFKQVLGALLGAFPDLRFTIEDLVACEDKVVTRWSAQGTHTGAFGNIPPGGRHVRIDGIVLDHVADGRVVERWEQWDQMGLMRQLGLA